jgi:hypothetical protein
MSDFVIVYVTTATKLRKPKLLFLLSQGGSLLLHDRLKRAEEGSCHAVLNQRRVQSTCPHAACPEAGHPRAENLAVNFCVEGPVVVRSVPVWYRFQSQRAT